MGATNPKEAENGTIENLLKVLKQTHMDQTV